MSAGIFKITTQQIVCSYLMSHDSEQFSMGNFNAAQLRYYNLFRVEEAKLSFDDYNAKCVMLRFRNSFLQDSFDKKLFQNNSDVDMHHFIACLVDYFYRIGYGSKPVLIITVALVLIEDMYRAQERLYIIPSTDTKKHLNLHITDIHYRKLFTDLKR